MKLEGVKCLQCWQDGDYICVYCGTRKCFEHMLFRRGMKFCDEECFERHTMGFEMS